MSEQNEKVMITDVFVSGVKRGWNIAIGSMLPNVLMAFVLIYFLKLIQERPAHLHLYEKEPRQDRKIGHINFPGHIRLEEPFIG